MEQWKIEYLNSTVWGRIRRFGTKEHPISAKEIALQMHMSVSWVYKQVAYDKCYDSAIKSCRKGYYYEE